MVADAVVREFVPHLLLRASQYEEARALQALRPITGVESARTALRALDVWAKDLHAARWVLERAIEEAPAARYVAGAVQIIKRAGDLKGWQLAIDVAERLSSSVTAEVAAG